MLDGVLYSVDPHVDLQFRPLVFGLFMCQSGHE